MKEDDNIYIVFENTLTIVHKDLSIESPKGAKVFKSAFEAHKHIFSWNRDDTIKEISKYKEQYFYG